MGAFRRAEVSELLVRSILVAAQKPKMMLELTQVQCDRETAREPVLRNLPSPLLVRVELHQARGLLAHTWNVVEVQDGGVHSGSNRDLGFGRLGAIIDARGCGRDRS